MMTSYLKIVILTIALFALLSTS